jgi:cyclopropane-fatty-acyl-phospholipid synthase
MSTDTAFKAISDLLAFADIKVNGERPWDIRVHNPSLYGRVLAGGSLGLGESYMDGWWDCISLDEFFCRVLSADLDQKVRGMKEVLLKMLAARLFNPQRKSKAFVIGEHHYDVGNDLYRAMLDSRMVYSCGYWETARTLDEAQEAKLDLICGKMGLRAGERILDIGCGWGSLAKFAAERYGVSVVGLTVSKEQAALARELCAGLPVEIRLQDYRDCDERFDHIVSVGMFEHVGWRNYRTFMEVVHRCLKPEGRFLLHTIGNVTSVKFNDPWVEKYIFPNSLLPSASQIAAAAEGLFVLRDWHCFGRYYDRTLMAWYDNFTRSWDRIKDRYDARFFRMWTYYLLASAGAFRADKNQLWQVVFTRTDSGDYQSPR